MLIKDLRERGKELRRQYADAQKRAREAAASQKPGASRPEAAEGSGGVGSDDAHVAEDLIKKRGEFDKMRRQTAHLRTELDKLMGDLIAINKMKGVVGGAAVAAAGGGSRRSSQQVDADGSGAGDGDDDGESGGGGVSSSAAAAAASGTPLQRRVRQLENRLDKTAVKHEEAVSIKRTYEQIVKRLRDERVSYDTQIAAMERAVASKSHDLDELKILANDSSRAIEQAQVELARVRAVAAADREKRQRELRERDGMARGRRLQAEMMIARDRARRDLLAEVAGDLGVSEERQLVRDVENARIERAKLSEQQTLVRRKLEAYEQAWRRIKDTTGVTEVVEVIVKMAGQVEQHQHLGSASRENVHRIEVIKEEIEAFRRFLEELRYSNSTSFAGASTATKSSQEIEGGGASSPLKATGPHEASALSTLSDVLSGMSMADSQSMNVRVPGTTFEEINAAMTNRLNKARDNVSDASLLLMSARIGTAHLGELLSVVREAAGVKPLGDVTEENLVLSMQSCQATLATIAERLRLYYEISGTDLLHPSGVEAEAATQAAAAAREAQRTNTSDATSIVITPSPQQLAALGLNDADLLNVRTFNTRVNAAKRSGMYEVESLEAPVAAEGDFLAESKGVAIGSDGKANELALASSLPADPSAPQEVFFADEGHDAARNTIKKQAQRNADSHKRSSIARSKESSGGGFSSAPIQEKSESKGGKQARKIAGPPRHQY